MPSNNYVDPRLAPYQQSIEQIFGNSPELQQSALGGGNLGMQLYGDNGLGRLDPNMSWEQGALLQRARDQSALGGNEMSPEVRQAMGQLGGASTASQLDSPLVQEALANRRQMVVDSGQMSPEAQNILNLRQGEYARSRELDPLMQETIGLQRDALGGLSTEEMLAQRELGSSELNRSMATALGQLRGNQLAGGGPQGAAANIQANPIVANYAEGQRQLQRQLILDDYTAKQNALNRFSDTGRYVDTTKFNRAQETLGNFSDDTQAIQNEMWQRRMNAVGGFDSSLQGFQQNAVGAANTFYNAAQGRQQFEITDRLNRMQNYQSTFSNIRNDLLQRQVFNMNQMAREKAGLVGSMFGAASFGAAEQGRKESLDFAKEQLDAAKEFGKGFNIELPKFSGFTGGGGGSGNQFVNPVNPTF